MKSLQQFLLIIVGIGLCVACSRPNRLERPARYHPSLLLTTEVKSGHGTVNIEFPTGYKLAADAPHKVLSPESITHTREGNTVTFNNSKNGENSYIDVYFCETEQAAICAFRPIEIEFDDHGPASTTVKIPAP